MFIRARLSIGRGAHTAGHRTEVPICFIGVCFWCPTAQGVRTIHVAQVEADPGSRIQVFAEAVHKALANLIILVDAPLATFDIVFIDDKYTGVSETRPQLC